MNATLVSLVGRASDTATRDISIEQVLEVIRTGGKRIRRQVELIRRIFKREFSKHGDYKQAKKAIDAHKRQFPAVTWSGVFSERASDKLVQYSGLLCADLDSLDGELFGNREKLLTSPHLWALFRSPTGDGLKAVFRVPADVSKHAGSFRAVEKHVRELTGIQIDQACKDVARLCFISYDPDLYVNPNAVEIEPLPEAEKPRATFSGDGAVNLSERQRIAGELLGHIEWQSETSGFVQCPGKHLHTTADGERDCKIDFDHVPTLHCFHDHCRGILDAINRELRGRIGKAEYQSQSEAQPSGKADDDSELTLLSSLGVAEYPTPLDEAAYYGLAGEIVGRILPQTEADPAALLSQLFAAFGNIIGRNTYMLADGARHYLNLFIVLVGKTSKGRKGTAWRHVLKLLRGVDEEWCKNIGHGLSSGEGLVWAVRDKIEGKKLIKEKGKPAEYKTLVIDDGVLDKRLLVIESEFASRSGRVTFPEEIVCQTGGMRGPRN